MIENKKSFYVTDDEGDALLVEIEEHYGMLNVTVGDKFIMSLDPDGAYDFVDALTILANNAMER